MALALSTFDPHIVMDGPAASLLEVSAPLPVRRSPGRRSGLAQRAVHALAAALRQGRPDLTLDAENRVATLRDLLLSTVRPAAGQPTILPERTRTPVDDPLALTANCFLPWSSHPAGLRLAHLTGFHDLRFAARCPTGIRGTPPQTDLLLIGADKVVAVVTRVTEHLTAPRTRIAEGYDGQLREPDLEAWHDLLARLRTAPQIFRLLDVVSLAKHAIGLRRTFPGRTTTLVYLFWEPGDARSHPVFAAHRAEVELLRQQVGDSGVPLVSTSVRELWERWQVDIPGDALRDHVAALAARYGVAIGG